MSNNTNSNHRRLLVIVAGIALLIITSSCATTRQVTYIVGVTATQDGIERVLKDRTYSLRNVVMRLSNGDRIKAKEIVFDGRTGEFRTDGILARLRLRPPRRVVA